MPGLPEREPLASARRKQPAPYPFLAGYKDVAITGRKDTHIPFLWVAREGGHPSFAKFQNTYTSTVPH